MKIDDFRIELAQLEKKSLIHQWFLQKVVQTVLDKLNIQNKLEELENLFQGISQHTYWIGYYKNNPFALVISTIEEKYSIVIDLIICDDNYQEKWLTPSLLQKIWPHVDLFYKLEKQPQASQLFSNH